MNPQDPTACETLRRHERRDQCRHARPRDRELSADVAYGGPCSSLAKFTAHAGRPLSSAPNDELSETDANRRK